MIESLDDTHLRFYEAVLDFKRRALRAASSSGPRPSSPTDALVHEQELRANRLSAFTAARAIVDRFLTADRADTLDVAEDLRDDVCVLVKDATFNSELSPDLFSRLLGKVVALMSASSYHVFTASEEYEQMVASNVLMPGSYSPLADDADAGMFTPVASMAGASGSAPQSSLVRAAREDVLPRATPPHSRGGSLSIIGMRAQGQRISHDAFIAAFDKASTGGGSGRVKLVQSATARGLLAGFVAGHTAVGGADQLVQMTTSTIFMRKRYVDRI